MTHLRTTQRTVRDVIQDAIDIFDPKQVMVELEKEAPSLDGQIKMIPGRNLDDNDRK